VPAGNQRIFIVGSSLPLGANIRDIAVGEQRDVVLDVEGMSGEVSEGEQMLARLDAAAAATGAPIATVTTDASHAHAKIHGGLESRWIKLIIPIKAGSIRRPVSMRRHHYDSLKFF
jgi:hypothetical protein